MPLWKTPIFRRSHPSGAIRQRCQLPGNRVAQEFGEVNVCESTGKRLVSVMLNDQRHHSVDKQWQTGVAIDASGSMETVFGKGLSGGPKGAPPKSLLAKYRKRGWVRATVHDAETFPVLTHEAKADLVARGHFIWSNNEVEPVARDFTAYLADGLDARGKTTVIYYSCGTGNEIEVIGDLTALECHHASFAGPRRVGFGAKNLLMPAAKYFADHAPKTGRGIFIFITDGKIADLSEIKRHTAQLCHDINTKNRNTLKFVLIGVGDEVDERQLQELDDLDSGSTVDLWDYKIAKEMRSLSDIFAEIVDENKVIASSGRVYDAEHRLVRNFPNGLPAKVCFALPHDSQFFDLEIEQKCIRQSISI